MDVFLLWSPFGERIIPSCRTSGMEDARSGPISVALVSVYSSPPKSFGALDDARPVSSHQPHRAVSATNPCSTPPEHAHDASHLSPARKHLLTAAHMSSLLVCGE